MKTSDQWREVLIKCGVKIVTAMRWGDVFADVVKDGTFSNGGEEITPPEDAKPGVYMWTGLAQVKGLLQLHEVEWYSEPFEVVKPERKK